MQADSNSHAKLRFTTWLRAFNWKDSKSKKSRKNRKNKEKPNAAEDPTWISPFPWFLFGHILLCFLGPWLVADSIFVLLIVTNCVAHATCSTWVCVCVSANACHRASPSHCLPISFPQAAIYCYPQNADIFFYYTLPHWYNLWTPFLASVDVRPYIGTPRSLSCAFLMGDEGG